MTDQRRDCVTWAKKRFASLVICWEESFDQKSLIHYTCCQTCKMGQMCTFQFMLLLVFVGISHSVILGGFIYFWWVLTSCGESPVLFHTSRPGLTSSQSGLETMVCNTLVLHTWNWEQSRVQEQVKDGSICVTQSQECESGASQWNRQQQLMEQTSSQLNWQKAPI